MGARKSSIIGMSTMQQNGLPRGQQPALSSEEWSEYTTPETFEPGFDDDEAPVTADGSGLAALSNPAAEVARPQVDQDKIKRAVVMMLEAIGEDPTREGLRETPRRIAEMYGELFAGLKQDPAQVLKVSF